MPRLHFKIKLSGDDAFKLKAQALNNDPRMKNAGIAGLKFSTDKQFIADGEFHAELPPEPASADSSGSKDGQAGSARNGNIRVSVRMDTNDAYKLKTEMLNGNPRLKEVGVSDFKLKKSQPPVSQPEVKQPQPKEEQLQPEENQFQSKEEQPQLQEEQKPQPEEKRFQQKEEQPQSNVTQISRPVVKQPESKDEQSQPREGQPQSKVKQKPKVKGRFFKAVGRLIKWGVGLSVVAVVAGAAILYVPAIRSLPVVEPLIEPLESVVESFINKFNELIMSGEPTATPTPMATERPIATPTPTTVIEPLVNFVSLTQRESGGDDPFSNPTNCLTWDDGSGFLIMTLCSDDEPSQVWRMELIKDDTNNKIWQLSPKILEEENICLTWSGDMDVFMDKCFGVPEQVWDFEQVEGGYYYLQTMNSKEENICLAWIGRTDVFMTPCSDDEFRQVWELVLVN